MCIGMCIDIHIHKCDGHAVGDADLNIERMLNQGRIVTRGMPRGELGRGMCTGMPIDKLAGHPFDMCRTPWDRLASRRSKRVPAHRCMCARHAVGDADTDTVLLAPRTRFVRQRRRRRKGMRPRGSRDWRRRRGEAGRARLALPVTRYCYPYRYPLPVTATPTVTSTATATAVATVTSTATATATAVATVTSTAAAAAAAAAVATTTGTVTRHPLPVAIAVTVPIPTPVWILHCADPMDRRWRARRGRGEANPHSSLSPLAKFSNENSLKKGS